MMKQTYLTAALIVVTASWTSAAETFGITLKHASVPESKTAHRLARCMAPETVLHARTRMAPPNQSGQATPTGENQFVGTWTANLSKSKRHPSNQFQSWVLQFDVVGDTVINTNSVVSASGQEERGTNTFQTDGKEHTSERNPALVFVARWVGSHALEVLSKSGGQMLRVTYEVSTDGKTLTARIPYGKDANGVAFEQVIVFDRQ